MFLSLLIPLLLGAKGRILHQIALSVLLVLGFEHKLQGYGFDRIRDSIIGVMTALVLHWLVRPPNFTKRVMAKLEGLPLLLMEKLKSLAIGWRKVCLKNLFEQDFLFIRKKLFEAETLMKKAEKGLKFSPSAKKSKPLLQEMELLLNMLYQMHTEIKMMFEILNEQNKLLPLTKEIKEEWAHNLYLLEAAIRNRNEGKTISDTNLVKFSSNETVLLPALWHGEHLISILKHSPLPTFHHKGSLAANS